MGALRPARKRGIRLLLLAMLGATLVTGGAGSLAARARAASTGLVAAYSFDQGSGSTLTDLSGNGNTGTIQNATWSSAGKYGGALSFNGSSSMVVVNDAPELDLTSGMTLEA